MAQLTQAMNALSISAGPSDPSTFAHQPEVLYPDDDFPRQLEDSCDDGQDDSQSLFSYNSTPERRKGVTFATAKRWLATWLVSVNMYYCHTTLSPFSARLNEFAHILVPQCAFKRNDILETVEFCLGMQYNALCLHSRLFLMPLFITLHRSLDWCHLFFLPTTDVIDLVTKYLESYFAEWVQNPGYRPWSKLRKGELRGFEALRDGTKYRYQLLSSPHFDLQLPIFVYRQQTHQVFTCPYTTFPEFESHVTPFAICVNTLRALEDWEHPREIQPIFRSRRMEHFAQIEQWTLLALLGLAKGVTPNVDPPGELLKRALAFRRFAEAFHELQQAYQGYKSNHQTQLQGHRRTTGSPEPSQHSTAEDHDPTSPTPPSRTKARRLLLSIAGGSKSTVDKSKKATMRVLHSFFNRSASLTEADRVRDAYLTSVTRDFAIPQLVLGRR